MADPRVMTCNTPLYNIDCLAGKPLETVSEMISKIAATNPYESCTQFFLNGKPICNCCIEKYVSAKLENSEIFEMADGAMESAVATIDGKKMRVIRLWGFFVDDGEFYIQKVLFWDE